MWFTTSKSRDVGWSCFLMAVNQSFYNVIMTPYISKHNDSTHILSYCLISMTVPCLSIPLIHATCPAHFHRQDTNFTTRKWPLHATLFTATDTDYTTAIYRRLYAFNEQERLPFPLSPLGYIQMGRILFFFFFFVFATRHKVIKSWKQTLKEALSKKNKKLLW